MRRGPVGGTRPFVTWGWDPRLLRSRNSAASATVRGERQHRPDRLVSRARAPHFQHRRRFYVETCGGKRFARAMTPDRLDNQISGGVQDQFSEFARRRPALSVRGPTGFYCRLIRPLR